MAEETKRELTPTTRPRTKAEALEMAQKWGTEWSHWNSHANPENQQQAYVTCAQHDAAEVQRLSLPSIRCCPTRNQTND